MKTVTTVVRSKGGRQQDGGRSLSVSVTLAEGEYPLSAQGSQPLVRNPPHLIVVVIGLVAHCKPSVPTEVVHVLYIYKLTISAYSSFDVKAVNEPSMVLLSKQD